MSRTFRASLRPFGVVLLAGFGLAVPACGGDGGGPTVDSFCAQRAQRECAAVAERCGITDAAGSCEPLRTTACMQEATAQIAGTRRFRGDNIGACLDKVSATYAQALITAAGFAAMNDACLRVYQGTAKRNELCKTDYDCDGKNMICDKGYCGERVLKSKGDNCANPGEVCLGETICRAVGQVSLCVDRQADTAVCNATTPCLETSYCVEGACRKRLANEATCGANDECASGYCSPEFKRCAQGLSVALYSAQCVSFGGPKAPGSAAADAGATD